MKRDYGVSEFLIDHVKSKPASFHMPGHKGRELFRECGLLERLEVLIDGDITEVEGADNLFQPETVIRSTMDKYKRIYNSRETYLSINGSSGGIISAILSVTSPGEKIAMARNCHKSVINGIRLGALKPVYIYPELMEFGISGAVTPEAVKETLDREKDCRVVLITNPSYYGVCSDVRAIAREVHDRGGILIVDQAHGAHLNIMDAAESRRNGPLSADGNGADIVIESTHKTMASFTQTAIVNIYGEKVSLDAFADKLQMIESSSPSYILMASLDMNAEIVEKYGNKLAERWRENLDYFYGKAGEIPGLRVFKDPRHDDTKLVFNFTDWQMTGDQVDALLQKEGVFLEMTSGNIAMAMTGIGNSREDYDRLLEGLKKIKDEFAAEGDGVEPVKRDTMTKYMYMIREQRDMPINWEKVHYSKAAGRVSAVSIIPYPPGAPMITPGEILDEESLEYAMEMRRSGAKVIGIDQEGYILVGEER